MYYQLTGAVADRIVEELRRFWSYHPRYKNRLVNNIQGSYAFKERPQVGIIVKVGGGTNVVLSADNYTGLVESYAYLTTFKDSPGLSIEWIREDSIAIQNNGGRFPSPPGIYFVDMIEDDQFVVDVLLDRTGEQVAKASCTEFQLVSGYVPGTLRLYEHPSGFLLREGINYTGDPATGALVLTDDLTGGRWLEADYRAQGDVGRGPFTVAPLRANNSAIPGVVLAFGRRMQKGDRMAVVVQPIRRPCALEYGGHWEISLDLEIFARDVHEAREIVDYSVIYLWGILRSHMVGEGFEIQEISMGGETEEVYDETGDDYYYNNTISMRIKTDWMIHVPLSMCIRQAVPLRLADAQRVAGLDDDGLDGEVGNIRILSSIGLERMTDPFFLGRNKTFEAIK